MLSSIRHWRMTAPWSRIPSAASDAPTLPVTPERADGWRRFASRRFRAYQLLAICQGVVMVLCGLDVIIPFALAIGCPPALATLLGALPVAGGMAQLLVPRLLDRTDGDLRRLTLLVAGGAELRGLALLVLALVVAVTGILGSVAGANLLAWHSAVLPEQDRRLVVPRLMAVSMAVGAVLLFPMGLVLDAFAERVGLLAYALPFGVAGAVGVAELFALRRLPHPGRVVVPRPHQAGAVPESPELRHFLRASVVNALGMGIAPYLSVYAIAVVGLSAGMAMSLGAVGMLTMVVVAAIAGGRLAHGSSARMLRLSFGLRAMAMAVPILALPGNPLAALLLCGSSMLGAAGFTTGQLAANERLFRLISGPSVIRHHGRYLARTSGAMAGAQLAGGAVLAVGGALGYPAFALLYGVSTALRIAAFRLSGAPAVSAARSAPPGAMPAGPEPAVRPA